MNTKKKQYYCVQFDIAVLKMHDFKFWGKTAAKTISAGQWRLNLREWIKICPHAWQPLKWVSMETMGLLSRALGAGDEDPDLSALSPALKTKLGLSDLKKPQPTMSPGVELLTSDVKSCRGIRSPVLS